MENKEAIKYLIAPVATSTKSYNEYLKQKEAYELAIKALEKPQVTVFAENASKEEIENFKQELENVLKRQQGEWINREAVSNTIFPFWERYECNQCHKFNGYSNFCPNCGAKMREDSENEQQL